MQTQSDNNKPKEQIITHDLPPSQSVANAIKRAKQFVNISWTPKRPMPMTAKMVDEKKRPKMMFEENVCLAG